MREFLKIDRQTKFNFVISSVAIIITVFFVLYSRAQAATSINKQINFQGKLVNTDGTNIANGTYNIEFKIYQDGNGVLGGGDETLKWTESRLRNNSQGVTVTDGVFQVNLGSVTAFGANIDFNQDTLWLSINLGNTNATCTPFSSCVGDGEMSPFVRFTASPYALVSGSIYNTDDGSTTTSIFLNKTGASGDIAALQKSGVNVFVLNNTGGLLLQNTTNSTTAFQVLTAAGSSDSVLAANTTNNRLKVGNDTATTGADTTLFVIDSATTANAPTAVNGGMFYDTTLGKFRCYEAAAWKNCAVSTLQQVYDYGNTITTTDARNITITSADTATDANIIFNLACATCSASGGLFSVQDNGTAVLTVNPTGSVDIAPTAGQALTTNLAAGSSANFTATGVPTSDLVTISNSGQASTTAGVDGLSVLFSSSNASGNALSITPSFAGGATDTLAYNAVSVGAFSPTNGAGVDSVNGFNLGNLTDPGASIISTGLSLGTGWDREVNFDDTTPTIRLGATDDTGVLSIIDSGSNTLLRLHDHSTNFGASVEAGAFIDYNSKYEEEFFKDRTGIIADGNQTWGDNLEWTAGETGVCTWDGLPDAINGITSIVATTTADFCSLYHSDLAASTSSLWLDADFLPTIVMKVRPSVAGAGTPDTDHQFFAGMSDGAGEIAPASGAPTNGIYFSNASDTAGTTGTANWYAVTDNGGASTNTACGVAVNETNFALLVIKVMSTSLVKFYIDADVSNGVSLAECGAGNIANINTGGMTSFLKVDWDANSNAPTLDVDFYRVWQDDAPTTGEGSSSDAMLAGSLESSTASLATVNGNPSGTGLTNLSPNKLAVTTKQQGLDISQALVMIFVLGAFIILLYKNRLAHQEIKQLSSADNIRSVVKSLLQTRNVPTNSTKTSKNPRIIQDVKRQT